VSGRNFSGGASVGESIAWLLVGVVLVGLVAAVVVDDVVDPPPFDPFDFAGASP
jgi:hypothetical protein